MRENVAGVDSVNFYERAKLLVKHMQHLTAERRNILLNHDGCRSHKTFDVLRLFRDNGIVVYEVPAYILEKTLFEFVKHKLHEAMKECTSGC